MYAIEDVCSRVELVIRETIKLGDDVTLLPDAVLADEVGIDSIEAFEAVAKLHELLGERIPEDLDPKSLATIRGISTYILSRFPQTVVSNFMEYDILDRLNALREDDELV